MTVLLVALWAFICLWYPLIFGLLGVLFWTWYIRGWNKWYNHPETVREREKEAYDTAHAYLKGKCCCGRNQEQD